MVVIDLQQTAALDVIVERKLLPAARQDRIAQPVQMQSGDADNIKGQRVAVGILQLVDGAGCRGALVRESDGSRKVKKEGKGGIEKRCTNSWKKSACWQSCSSWV